MEVFDMLREDVFQGMKATENAKKILLRPNMV